MPRTFTYGKRFISEIRVRGRWLRKRRWECAETSQTLLDRRVGAVSRVVVREFVFRWLGDLMGRAVHSGVK